MAELVERLEEGMSDENCGNCKYFQKHGNPESVGGICRRNPPLLVINRGGDDIRWPDTINGYWCGEFSPIEKKPEYKPDGTIKGEIDLSSNEFDTVEKIKAKFPGANIMTNEQIAEKIAHCFCSRYSVNTYDLPSLSEKQIKDAIIAALEEKE